MADVELFVEMRKFAPGILEEEAAAEGKRSAKQVHKEDGKKNQNRCSVGVVEDRLIAGHEPQLVEQPESVAQQDNDGEQQSVGDHFSPPLRSTRLRGFVGLPAARGISGRASPFNASFEVESESSEVEGPSGESLRKASSGKRSMTLLPSTS